MKTRPLLFAALGTAALVRLLLVLLVPPGTDVFYYDRQAVEAILKFQNPYSLYFTGIPAALVTPGAERVFAYLPFVALYLIPFYFTGDVRIGFIVADLIIGLVLYQVGDKSVNVLLLYLFVPFTIIFSTIYLNNSLIAGVFFSLFVISERRGKPYLGAISLGIALSAIQFSWLLFPLALCYYLRRGRWREVVGVVAVATFLISPFLLADPAAFYADVINFQFGRSVPGLITRTGPLGYELNLSLNGLLATFLNFTLPVTVRVLLTAAFLPFLALRVRNIEGFLVQGSAFLLLAIFILPNHFFWAYTELPFLLFLTYMSIVRYGRLGMNRTTDGSGTRAESAVKVCSPTKT